MKTQQPHNDINGVAERALLLPCYEVRGDSIIPPCRLVLGLTAELVLDGLLR